MGPLSKQLTQFVRRHRLHFLNERIRFLAGECLAGFGIRTDEQPLLPLELGDELGMEFVFGGCIFGDREFRTQLRKGNVRLDHDRLHRRVRF